MGNLDADRLEKGITSEGHSSGKSVDEPASTSTRIFWLLIWMMNNILVTMLNKAAFATVDFKYPYALSAIHMACNIIGCQIYFLFSRTVKPKQLEPSSRKTILFFSIIFSMNIAIGNTSLRWVSVNFNQICRALVPAMVMLISTMFYQRTYSRDRKMALIPIVIGVATAFYGDMSFTMIGVFYTMLCVFLAALKAVLSGELLTGDLKLGEIDLLSKMCPLALMQVLFIAIINGEVAEIYSRWGELAIGAAPQVILLSGILSFSLNVTSFIANKVTSALDLCIAANVKQVLLMTAGTLFFGDQVSLINGIGIAIVIIGSYRYGVISISEK